MYALAMLFALLFDAAIGWPDRLFKTIGHPVTWLGRLIARLDAGPNSRDAAPTVKRLLGIATLVVVVAVAALAAGVIQWALIALALGPVTAMLLGVAAWPLVAARSLYTHVAAVARPLERGDLDGARAAVAMIVGRDVTALDAAGVIRASVESLSENASDGVVAPLFWGALLGLPGIAAYKAINTLDSMIGHRTPRHRYFGWASARVDDVANLAPARLTGLLIALASGAPARSMMVMWRDARKHRSPNAGYPEAAMAGAIGARLSGPRTYHDRIADEPWINAAAPDPSPADLRRALSVYIRALVLGALLLLAGGALLIHGSALGL